MAAPMRKFSLSKFHYIFPHFTNSTACRCIKLCMSTFPYKQKPTMWQSCRKIAPEFRNPHLKCGNPRADSRGTASAPISSATRRAERQRFSRMYENVAMYDAIPTESEISCRSQRLMLYNGVLAQSHPGVYHLLPMGIRSLNKLKKVINEEMRDIGAQEVSLPSVTPGELWKTSGRWEATGSELFKLKDRHNIDYCLGPTHEEPITSLVATHKHLSHRQLPIKLYQITRKFRDEMSPKYGLLRGREFEMKDLYTFDANLSEAKDTYEQVNEAYVQIFNRLGLNFVKVEGDTGNIGGQLSHEYHLTADVGEDNLVTCKRCGFGANEELVDKENLNKHKCQRPECGPDFSYTKGIEVGHAFLLGQKYSKIFNAVYLNDQQKSVVTEMGCYGLGVTRILAAAIEVMSQENRIRWPLLMAPYQICIIPQKEGFKSEVTNQLAESLYDNLTCLPSLQWEVVIDDRTQLSIGKRMYHADRLGYPYIIILGKKALESPAKFEVKNTYTEETEYLEMEELLAKMSQVETL